MKLMKTAGAVAIGLASTLSVASLAQDGPAAASALVLDELGTVDWIEKSSVAALREGVVEKMELRLGDTALAGKPIGYLHRETAELTVKKSQVQANMTGAIEKGKASSEAAIGKVARDQRLIKLKGPGMVSEEDRAIHEAEFKVAEAQVKEAVEAQAVAKAELDMAIQALKEHTIVAPFDGIVIKRMKNPGESVRANEAVVELGKLSRLSVNGYVPLKESFKVKEGQVVEIRARVDSPGGGREDIEGLTFRGKVTFVDPQVQALGELKRRIRAEFDNPDFKLIPGLKVQMTIFLNGDIAARIPEPNTR
ncbi:macrolide transporter subunit MacA [Aquisphaera giovannonii]|uniref:Macrolide transporter subunit MacA n=1 Tax=Aquisphaera giovannonii TaxID=406548 RepID=A0A5B9VX41_9BACT|nr:efflux RND transporter periplasmic adaptor subunit [Aquisphaera giovannonii]QEH32956.1 macrolide transporter subunit MacA [Aquisphaera giovannonii]